MINFLFFVFLRQSSFDLSYKKENIYRSTIYLHELVKLATAEEWVSAAGGRSDQRMGKREAIFPGPEVI